MSIPSGRQQLIVGKCTSICGNIKEELERSDAQHKVHLLQQILRKQLNGTSQSHLAMPLLKSCARHADNHILGKLLHHYFDAIDKSTADGTLIPEMLLVCASLQADLKHTNEYVRATVLRAITRISEIDILKQVSSYVEANIHHTNPIVRRTAWVAVKHLHTRLPDALIPHAVSLAETALEVGREDDPSSRRHAFALLVTCAPDRALRIVHGMQPNGRWRHLNPSVPPPLAPQVNQHREDLSQLHREVIRFITSVLVTAKTSDPRTLLTILIDTANTSGRVADPSIQYEAAVSLARVAQSRSSSSVRADAGVSALHSLSTLLSNHIADSCIRMSLLQRIKELIHDSQTAGAALNEVLPLLFRALGSSSGPLRLAIVQFMAETLVDTHSGLGTHLHAEQRNFFTLAQGIRLELQTLRKQTNAERATAADVEQRTNSSKSTKKKTSVHDKKLVYQQELLQLLRAVTHRLFAPVLMHGAATPTILPTSLSALLDVLQTAQASTPPELLLLSAQTIRDAVVVYQQSPSLSSQSPCDGLTLPSLVQKLIDLISHTPLPDNALDVLLWTLGAYFESLSNTEEAESGVRGLMESIQPFPGELPASLDLSQQVTENAPRYRTVVRADGTYGTELITHESNKPDADASSQLIGLRGQLIKGHYHIAPIFAQTLMAGCLRAPTCAADVLSLLESLISFGKESMFSDDNGNLVSIMSRTDFISLSHTRQSLEKICSTGDSDGHGDELDIRQLFQTVLSKAVINLRIQLKRQLSVRVHAQRADTLTPLSVSPLICTEFISKWSHIPSKPNASSPGTPTMVQFSGFADPVYVEASVSASGFDTIIDITALNQTSVPLNDCSFTFTTSNKSLAMVSPTRTYQLPPSGILRTSVHFVTSNVDTGIIKGLFRFKRDHQHENKRKQKSECLALLPLKLDVMNYIRAGPPSAAHKRVMSLEEYRHQWNRLPWENRIQLEHPLEDLQLLSSRILNEAHLSPLHTQLNREEMVGGSEHLLQLALIASTVFGDLILGYLSLETNEEEVNGVLHLRSNAKNLTGAIGNKLQIMLVAKTDALQEESALKGSMIGRPASL